MDNITQHQQTTRFVDSSALQRKMADKSEREEQPTLHDKKDRDDNKLFILVITK